MRRLRASDAEAAGVVRCTTASESWEWLSLNHPGILDGSLQLAGTLQTDSQTHHQNQMPSLPFMISRAYFSTRPAPVIYVHASQCPQGTVGHDLQLLRGGFQYGKIDGFQTRTFRATSQACLDCAGSGEDCAACFCTLGWVPSRSQIELRGASLH
eukprot:gnl/MRDRNA2_/MRDRNA2_86738_c0_seq6.p1 gnl/MRDRNA2_/MRDRNA2_86738_c0~~gnl/MRDRNA2_/MRDRNA2_86738_c0_seq6.p1  ORF type:complete len:155 (+),score=7.38 gnl/MRDRNA2_/MRDRNA2_86738_c0_seq6:3-467(+)